MPSLAQPVVQSPTSFAPCWVQAPSERVNTHAAPKLPPSKAPPISAVLPSPESAALAPNQPLPLSPVPSLAQLLGQSPTSFAPCWVQAPPERVNTHAAPAPSLSVAPPISAVFPSSESATLRPNWPTASAPLSPVPSLAQPVVQSPTSFAPCWVQAPPERVNTHAAPAFALSYWPPISAVLPSAESAT